MSKPSDQYAPTMKRDITPIIKDFYLDGLSDSDATIFTTSLRDERLAVKLTDMFSLDKTSHAEKTAQLETPRIATFSLEQHQKMFEALMGDESVKQEVITLLQTPACKKGLFMIVGAKVVYDGSISIFTDLSRGQKLKTIVPLAQIAAAAASNPMPVLRDQNPEIDKHKEEAEQSDVSYGFSGARIFAFEYRKVTLPRSIFSRQRKDPHFSPDTPGMNFGHQVFSHGEKEQGASVSDSFTAPLSIKTDESSRSDGRRSQTSQRPDPDTESPVLEKSSVKLADVGDLGIGWQTDSLVDGNLLYEVSDPGSDLDESDVEGEMAESSD
jgi:hypothetical protein